MNDIHGLKQAQEALRASEAELRLIMDNVPARVSYIDHEYRYRFVNRHDEDVAGRKPQGAYRPARSKTSVATARFAPLQPIFERVLAGRDRLHRTDTAAA